MCKERVCVKWGTIVGRSLTMEKFKHNFPMLEVQFSHYCFADQSTGTGLRKFGFYCSFKIFQAEWYTGFWEFRTRFATLVATAIFFLQFEWMHTTLPLNPLRCLRTCIEFYYMKIKQKSVSKSKHFSPVTSPVITRLSLQMNWKLPYRNMKILFQNSNLPQRLIYDLLCLNETSESLLRAQIFHVIKLWKPSSFKNNRPQPRRINWKPTNRKAVPCLFPGEWVIKSENMRTPTIRECVYVCVCMCVIWYVGNILPKRVHLPFSLSAPAATTPGSERKEQCRNFWDFQLQFIHYANGNKNKRKNVAPPGILRFWWTCPWY